MATIVGLALLCMICGRWLLLALYPPQTADNGVLLVEGPCEVIEVLDGPLLVVRQTTDPPPDSTVTNRVVRRVRLIGIQTEHNATDKTHTAAEFVRKHVAGKEVRLQFDKRRVDRDHMWLAYVYVDEGLLNERLLEEGLTRVDEYPGDSAAIAKRMKAAETRAKAGERGLWASGNL